MFIVTVSHNCKSDMVEQAIDRIDRNGRAMAEVEGFLYRYRTRRVDDVQVILTITGWETEKAYRHWLDIKKGMPDEGPSPYVGANSEQHVVEAFLTASR